ncbi:MAG: glutamine-hydrolyzing carbamoyl-phosphate synthase small subunit [Thermoprotei archaeon]
MSLRALKISESGLKETESAVLLLEDGSVFRGEAFGFTSSLPVAGEVVFNTGMVGYVEAMTDPSYRGQLLCFTYPLIGNYGVPAKRYDDNGILSGFESERIQVAGVIAHWVSDKPSHYESSKTLDEWMGDERVPGIMGVDTRELTIHLREKGVMFGAIAHTVEDAEKAIRAARSEMTPEYYKAVSTGRAVRFGKSVRGRVGVVDCGLKLNIVRSLVKRGLEVVVYPYNVKFDQLLDDGLDGVVLSNGPGDPNIWVETIGVARRLIDEDVPTLGICLGYQLLALAEGAHTFKLKYGHRGQNKPVIDLSNGRSMVTSQNHGYAVSRESIVGTPFEEWFLNVDDETLEGVKHTSRRCLGVQFHPEASPGPVDGGYVFDVFVRMLGR